MSRIGVLALQGGFEAHAKVLRDLGAEAVEVRRLAELSGVEGLVIPGGESTTLLNLMADEPWREGIRSFHARGGAVMGTCAGAILLAREVRNPAQESIGLLDATIERNAFGRQVDSFETTLDAPTIGGRLDAVFIRAPRITRVGAGVEVLARLAHEPVLVREGRVLAMTFHPELTDDAKLHATFLAMAGGAALKDAGERVPAGRFL